MTGNGAVSEPERSEAVLSERPQCLVIDGHPIVRLGMRRALGEDFEVQEAVTRSEAIELVRDIGGFDIAIVDMRVGADGTAPSIDPPDAIRAMLRAEPAMGIVAHGN